MVVRDAMVTVLTDGSVVLQDAGEQLQCAGRAAATTAFRRMSISQYSTRAGK